MKVKVPYKSVINKDDFIDFYRAFCSRKICANRRQIKDVRAVNRVHLQIWKTISDMYKNAEGGVFIDGIGYFCHVIKPDRKWGMCKMLDVPIRYKTNGFPYRHMVVDSMIKPRRFYHIHKSILPFLFSELKRLTPIKRYKLMMREVKSYMNCSRRRKIVSLYSKK